MNEILFGGNTREPLYGAVEQPDGWLEVRVYHQNLSCNDQIRRNQLSPQYFLDRFDSNDNISARKQLARLVSGYRGFFESEKVRFVWLTYPTSTSSPNPVQSALGTKTSRILDTGQAEVRLREIGFKPVGKCQVDPTLNSGVRFSLSDQTQDRVVYAYIVNSDAKYIGICENSETTLGDRMLRYQGMAGSGTNARIVHEIKECLIQGKTVTIWAWKPADRLETHGLQVDLVKGLENPLIQKFQPEWNIKR